MSNPYLDFLEQDEARRRQQQRAALETALDTNPDEFARQRLTARQLGVPPAAVEMLPDEMQRRAAQLQLEKNVAQSPVLQRRYSDADFARLAHDDSPALSKVAAAVTRYVMGAGRRGLPQDLAASPYLAASGVAEVARGLIETFPAPWLDWMEQRVPGGNPLRRLAEGFAIRSEQARATAEDIRGPRSLDAPSFVEEAVSSGAVSLGQNLLLMPSVLLGPPGQRAALTAMASIPAGDAYRQGVEQGMSPAAALTLGASQGLVEFATERLPVSALVKDLSVAAPLYKVVLNQLAREIPGEQVATILQDLNEWAALPQNADKPFSQYLAERPSAAAQTLIATIVGVGGNVMVTSALAKVADSALDEGWRVQLANERAQQLTDLLAAAGASKLKMREPQSLASLVQEMAAETPEAPQEVYIDARILMGEDGQGGLLNQEQLAELLPSLDREAATAAALAGGDVALPIGELVANISGTPLEQKLVEHLRVDPEALSVAEARAASERAAEFFQSSAEQAMAGAVDQTAMLDSAEKVKETIKQQLTAVGRFTEDVNDAYAALVRDFYTTLAADLGVTPEQAYQQYPLRVGGVNPAAGELAQGDLLDLGDLASLAAPPAGDATGVQVNASGESAASLEAQGRLREEQARDRPRFLIDTRTGAVRPLIGVDAVDATARSGQVVVQKNVGAGQWTVLSSGNDVTRSALSGAIARAQAEGSLQQRAAGVEPGNKHGFWPALRTKVRGRLRLPEKPLILAGTTNKNARRQLDELDGILTRFPNATDSADQWSRMMAYALASDDVPVPPFAFIRDLNGTGSVDKLRTLTPGQIDDATHGFENAAEFRRAYTAGELGVETTGKLFLWSFLSRGVSPYTQESLFIDAFNGADRWIRKAAAGDFTEADFPEYEAWARSVAPKGSGQPGAGATHNLGAFGRNFLFRMGQKGEDGISHLQRLHDMMSDPAQTGRRIRREFATFGEGVGIDNKVVSFTLLVTGFNDVMVLDRVQFRQLWDDGRFSDTNLYDGVNSPDGKKLAGSSLNSLAEGVRGILVYEAIERGLEAKIRDIYAALGRPQDASIGRYHWETWVAESQQEASHGTLGAILADAKGDDQAIARVSAKQGEYGAFEYGALYNRDADGLPWFGYTTPAGSAYAFSVPAFRAFLEDIKNPATGVVPRGFRVTESGNGPWFNRPEVDQQRLDERARYWADRAGGSGEGQRALEEALRQQAADGAGSSTAEESAPEPQFDQDIAELKDGTLKQGPAGSQPPAAGGLLDAGRVRGGAEPLVDPSGSGARDDQPLAGLPAVVRVDGRDVTFGPFAPALRAAERYMARAGLSYNPPRSYAKIDRERAARIAQAFEEMAHAPDDPRVKAAYDAMIRETVAQWQAVKETGLRVEFIDGPDPYGNPRNAILDVVENNHLWVYPTDAGFGGSESAGVDITGNPLLAIVPGETISGRPVRVNDLFRIVHDYFGHIKDGVGFRAEGEENAWRSHWAMFSPLARAALTTETRGQNSWVNFGPFGIANATADGATTQYAPQKIGLLPDWVVNEGATDELLQSPVAPTVGIHFSASPRTVLDGRFYGTGLKGAEGERVRSAADPRLKARAYFYIDEGNGVRPEAGVGGYAHEVQLPPLYDAKADPLKLWNSGDLNATESRILDAGFSGYFIRDAFNGQGAAVVIGESSRAMPAKQIANPTSGYRPPPRAPQPYRRSLMSTEISAVDIAKVQAVAPSARLRAGAFSVDPAEFDAAREVMAAMGVDLPVAESVMAQGPRGSFSPSQLKITLLETADLSTFLHETGHFFLEVMADVSSRPDAPLRVREDTERLLDWFGIKGQKAEEGKPRRSKLDVWRSMSLDEQRPYHERFAEAFEQYLFEGKAPTAELQPLFQRIRAWMTAVYRSLTDFLASHDTKLTPTVRQVFDRMIAAEDAIKATEAARAYQPIFENAQQAGMTAEEWEAYQALGKQATERAIDQLAARSLREMRHTSNARSRVLRALQREMADKRKAVEAEVRAEQEATPLERARAYLRELRATSPEDKAAFKAWEEKRAEFAKTTRATVRDEFLASEAGRDLKGLKKGQFLAANKRAIDNETERRVLQWERENPRPKRQQHEADMQVVADMFEFSSADELEAALKTAPPLAETIEGLTDQRMLERYGELTTQAGMEAAADEAIHNETRGRFMAAGLRALLAGTKQTEPTGKTVKGKDGKTRALSTNVIVKAAKDFAQQLVARRKVRELKPGVHTRAEARAGRLAAEAMAANNTQAAITAQRDALLNHYAASATEKAMAEVDRGVRYLRKLAGGTSLPPEYQEQVEVLLERFDLRDRSLKAIDRSKSLAEWVKSQEEMGVEPELPPGLLDEALRKSYKDMTVEEFRGLVDTVKQIEHLGRLKNKLLTAKDEREFAATRDALVASIEANAGDRQADTRTPTTNLGRALQAMRNFGAAHIKAATLARILDGGKDGGPMWETFIRAANERGDWETTKRAEATQALSDILGPWLKRGKAGGKGVYFPSIKRSLNREAVLTIALNTGNASNMQRLLGGEGWTETQLRSVLSTLTREDWQTVQDVWDYFESWRPQIAEKQKRVYGVEPKWIEPTPRTVDFDDGTSLDLRGGYYPVKYDPAASVRAEEHADAEGAKRQLQGAYGAATTRRSFTKTRAEEVTGRPLLYTLSGVYSGVTDVIHDLAWHEWLIDANRLLKSESLDKAIREHYGPAAVRQLKSWRDAVAEGDGTVQEAIDVALGRLRQGVSVAGLGFNVISALIQPLGYTQTIVRIGPLAAARGMREFIASPIAATRKVYEASPFMENRWRTRFRELNELRNTVQGETKVRSAVNNSAYWLMMRVQQMVDVPTWLGAYERAIADGNDETRARALADQAVIDSQGSGMVKDLSAIERGGPAQKLFTVFYSFMNTSLNLGVAEKMTPGSKARFAANMLLLYTIPAVLGSVLKDALTPGDGGEEDDWKALARKLIGEQLAFLMGQMVVLREFSEAAKMMAGVSDHPRDYQGPAGLRVIADTGKLATQTSQGEFDEGFRKAFINVMGSLFALPAAQINRSITGFEALKDGKTQNPAALLLGYQEPN